MRKFIKTFAVVASVMSLLMIAAAPANATGTNRATVAVVAINGTATVTTGVAGGIYLPVSDDCGPGVCPGRSGDWTLNLGVGLVGGSVGLSVRVVHDLTQLPHYRVYARVGEVTGSISGTLGASPVSTAVTTNAPGATTDGAWCGASTGAGGSGTITNSPLLGAAGGGVEASATPDTGATTTAPAADSVNVSGVGWLQSAGTLIVATGNATDTATPADDGAIVAVVSAIPPSDTLGGGSCRLGTGRTFRVVGAALATTSNV